MDRRTFLRYLAAIGVGTVVSGVAGKLARKLDEELYEMKQSKYMLGTVVTISAMSPDPEIARRAVDSAFREIDRLEGMLSRYRKGGQVYTLNEKGFLDNASQELVWVLEKARYYSEISDGAFDVTVKPLLDLYTRCFWEERRTPTDDEIERALRLVDYKKIAVYRNEVWLEEEGMGITLDGIAKGFIVDRAVEVQKRNGVEHGFVNAGGDLRVIGGKGAGNPWRIGIKSPENEREYLGVIELREGSVATSGNYEIFFNEEKTYHHIVNPRLGRSPVKCVSVTVTAEKAVDADALSTAVFVLNPERGLELVEGMNGVEALIITRDGTRVTTSRFRYIDL